MVIYGIYNHASDESRPKSFRSVAVSYKYSLIEGLKNCINFFIKIDLSYDIPFLWLVFVKNRIYCQITWIEKEY